MLKTYKNVLGIHARSAGCARMNRVSKYCQLRGRIGRQTLCVKALHAVAVYQHKLVHIRGGLVDRCQDSTWRFWLSVHPRHARTSASSSGWRSRTLSNFTRAKGGLVLPVS